MKTACLSLLLALLTSPSFAGHSKPTAFRGFAFNSFIIIYPDYGSSLTITSDTDLSVVSVEARFNHVNAAPISCSINSSCETLATCQTLVSKGLTTLRMQYEEYYSEYLTALNHGRTELRKQGLNVAPSIEETQTIRDVTLSIDLTEEAGRTVARLQIAKKCSDPIEAP